MNGSNLDDHHSDASDDMDEISIRAAQLSERINRIRQFLEFVANDADQSDQLFCDIIESMNDNIEPACDRGFNVPDPVSGLKKHRDAIVTFDLEEDNENFDEEPESDSFELTSDVDDDNATDFLL